MRRAVWVLTLAGCNQIYGLDPTTVRDLEPPACSTVQFGPPRELAQFAGGDAELDAQLSADGNEIWFTSNTPATSNNLLMFRGIRRSADEPYAITLVDLVGKNPVSSFDAALTADGRRMMFAVRETPPTLYEGVRQTATQFPFDEIVAINGFGEFPFGVESLDLTWDGLRIYFSVDGGVLYTGERAARNQPFGEFTMLFDNAQFPTVSGDELEIFYTRVEPPDRRLFRRARRDRTDPFGAEELVLDEGRDPDIAPTSSTMIVARNSGLSILERTCD